MMEQKMTEVQAPVAKAVTAIGAGAGTSVVARTQEAMSFFPQTLGEWLSAAASTAALIYSVWLIVDAWRRRKNRKRWNDSQNW